MSQSASESLHRICRVLEKAPGADDPEYRSTALEALMKAVTMAAAFFLFALIPSAYADESSQKRIAEELLITLKVDQMMRPVFDQTRSMLEQQFHQMGASEEMKPILRKHADNLYKTLEQSAGWEILKEDIVAIYVQTFTEDELKSMQEFYRSPVGQSVIRKMPVALQQSMATMQQRLPELQQNIRRAAEEMADEINAEKAKTEKKGP